MTFVGRTLHDQALEDENAELKRQVKVLNRVRAAAKEMLNFGMHKGECLFVRDGGQCVLHAEAKAAREMSLRSYLAEAERLL
jgi:hypothetical protein